MIMRKLLSLASVLSLIACGGTTAGDDGSGGNGGDKTAPACTFGADTKEIFGTPIIPANVIHSSLILGDMSPEEFEEAFPNWEMGFAFGAGVSEVPVLAPTQLHMESFRHTYFRHLEEVDYSFTFWVCDQIRGELHHVTGLSEAWVEALATRLGSTLEELTSMQVEVEGSEVTCSMSQINQAANAPVKDACITAWLGSAASCNDEDTLRRCTVRFTQDGGDFLVISEGAELGTAANFADSTLRPGLDFNMLDRRHTWSYVNPARLGDPQEHPAQSRLHAACPYEYFADATYRQALLSTVSKYDPVTNTLVTRQSATEPCGTLNIGKVNTAAGAWIYEGAAQSEPGVSLSDINLNEHHVTFHNNVLALVPDALDPDNKQVISTPLTELININGTPELVRFELGNANNINTAYDAMQPGKLYCLQGTSGITGQDLAFLLTFTAGNSPSDQELWLQPFGSSCPADPGSWTLDTKAALRFVR